MGEKLRELLEIARRVELTEKQKAERRKSFAYGNAGFENALITREMVEEEAEALERAHG